MCNNKCVLCTSTPTLPQVLQHPHGMTIFEDDIYWSERYTSTVMRTNKFHGGNITTVLNDVNQPMGVVMSHAIKQPAGSQNFHNGYVSTKLFQCEKSHQVWLMMILYFFFFFIQPSTHAVNTCVPSCACCQDWGPGTTAATVSLAGSWIPTNAPVLKVGFFVGPLYFRRLKSPTQMQT